MKTIIVSVVVISYNQDEYIEQCLNSILEQEFKEGIIEILVHDDNSTDDSRVIIDKFASDYPDSIIKIYPEKNTFKDGAYKILIENALPRCSGDYIMFCEADDYWIDKHKVKKQYDALSKNCGCAACVHSVNLLDGESEQILSMVPNDKLRLRYNSCIPSNRFLYDWIDEGCFFAFNSVMVKREIFSLQNIPQFFKVSFCMDYTVMLLAGTCGDIYFIDEIMGSKRVGNLGSLSYKAKKTISSEVLLNNLNMDINCFQRFNEYTNYRYKIQIVNAILKRKVKIIKIKKQNDIKHIFWEKVYQKTRYNFKNFFRNNIILCNIYLSIENMYLNKRIRHNE